MYGARFKVGTMENYSYQRYEKKLQKISPPFSPAIPPFSPCLRCLRELWRWSRMLSWGSTNLRRGTAGATHILASGATFFGNLVGFVGKNAWEWNCKSFKWSTLMNHVEVCWFCAEVDIVALGESVLASLRCMAWFPCSLPKKDARPSLKFFEAKRCQVLRVSLVPFSWKPIPCRNPTLIFDDFGVQTPSLSPFWAFWAFWASFHQVNIHWSSSRFSQVWLSSYFPSYNPQLLAQLEDYLEIRKLQWLDEVTLLWQTWVLEINQQTYFNLYT